MGLKLIVGLGNPGNKYERTRHNIGFMAVERLAERLHTSLNRNRFHALTGEASLSGEKILLLKPQTFMNKSGLSVSEAMQFYKVGPEDLLVVYDDLDLPFGGLRMRESGSSGGHKGMTDIIRAIGTQQFARLRLGIDRPLSKESTVDFVLKPFHDDQWRDLEDLLDASCDAIETFVKDGPTMAASRHNRSPKKPEPETPKPTERTDKEG